MDCAAGQTELAVMLACSSFCGGASRARTTLVQAQLNAMAMAVAGESQDADDGPPET